MKYLYNQSKTKIRFNIYVWCGVKLWKKSLLKHSLKLHKITYATFNFLFRVRFFFVQRNYLKKWNLFPRTGTHLYDYMLIHRVCFIYIAPLRNWRKVYAARKKSRCISHSQETRTKAGFCCAPGIAHTHSCTSCFFTFWQVTLDIFSRKSGMVNIKQC